MNNLLPHQKDALEWATSVAPTSHIVGSGQTALPLLIDDVKREKGGYRVYSGGKWKYYAACCLSDEDNRRFEWLLDEYGPGKVRS